MAASGHYARGGRAVQGDGGMPELFQATFGDWRFAAVALVALIAGLVRAFPASAPR